MEWRDLAGRQGGGKPVVQANSNGGTRATKTWPGSSHFKTVTSTRLRGAGVGVTWSLVLGLLAALAGSDPPCLLPRR